MDSAALIGAALYFTGMAVAFGLLAWAHWKNCKEFKDGA